MAQSTLRAVWKMIIFGAVLIAFLSLFFAAGGPSGFAHDKGRIVAVTILFAAGYISFFIMIGVTRARGGAVSRDERDERIEGRAGGVTLTVVLVYVYMLSIVLWVFFQGKGSVPAGWMWFLGYSTVFLGMIVHGFVTLIMASGKAGDAEG